MAALAALLLPGCVDVAALMDSGPSLPEALLRADPYRDLVVEVDAVPGQEPCPGTVAALRATLLVVTAKRSVDVRDATPIPAGDGSYGNKELSRLHARHLDAPRRAGAFGAGDAAVLHVVFLNGHAERAGGGHAAGRTLYEDGALFVFKDGFRGAYDVRAGARRDASCEVERTVVLHELGHALGLVNRGVPMLQDREAPDHAGHSTNPDSVMHPTLRLEGDGRLAAPLPPGFDAADLADLAAFRAA